MSEVKTNIQRITHGSWDSSFTLCGKTVDSLRHDEFVLEMQYEAFEYWYGQFQNSEYKQCKFCALELKQEAQLRCNKNRQFDDEVDMPVL